MKQIFKLVVAKTLLVNLLYVQCHPMRYPAYEVPSDYRYTNTPLVYRDYPPMDTYEAPSTQTRMYYPRVPYQVENQRSANSNFTFGDFVNSLNDMGHHHEKSRHKTGTGLHLQTVQDGLRHSIHGVKHEHTDEESIPTHKAELSAEDHGVSISFEKPDWSSIDKPETTNMDKWSGLTQLILPLISGFKSGSLDLTGFKDIILNGIVKPILDAKGNIKSFIGKITIPLVSLVLINIEVLFTVWWLWEDCSKEMKMECTDDRCDHSTSNHHHIDE